MFPFQILNDALLIHIKGSPHSSATGAIRGIIHTAGTRYGFQPTPSRVSRFGGNRTYFDELSEMENERVWNEVEELLWKLAADGILVLSFPDPRGEIGYRLTAYGRKVLEQETRPSPYDPAGFMAALRKQNPDCPELVLGYVEEAVATFNARCPRASAVMLGCASEALILDLATTLIECFPDEARGISGRMSGTIAPLYAEVRTVIEKLGKNELKPHIRFNDNWPMVDAMFKQVMNQRNGAGHPQALPQFTREMVHMTLTAFLGQSKAVFLLIDAVKAAADADAH